MSVSVRDWLKGQLVPLLPNDWRFIEHQRMPETITQTTVVLKHLRIEKLPEAPLGNLRNSVTLTVADYRTDQTKAEDALDDAVLELVTALDGNKSINWTSADKVLVNDTYLGWDVSLTVITNGKEG